MHVLPDPPATTVNATAKAPLAPATRSWRLYGVCLLAVGALIAAGAVALHGPIALGEAGVTAAIAGLFIWALVFRPVLNHALGAPPAPAEEPREEPGGAQGRATRVTLIVTVVLAALTIVAGGTPAGLALGLGAALLLLARLLDARERETGLRVLYEPRLLRTRAIHEDLYVESA